MFGTISHENRLRQYGRALLPAIAGLTLTLGAIGCGDVDVDVQGDSTKAVPTAHSSNASTETATAAGDTAGTAAGGTAAGIGAASGTTTGATPGGTATGTAAGTGGATTATGTGASSTAGGSTAGSSTAGSTAGSPGTGDVKTAGEFSHDAFDELLRTNVSGGKVRYSAFRNNRQFDAYLDALAKASLDGMSSDDKLAFWINAYNASTIKNVLDHSGIKKPTDVGGFFDKDKFTVAERSVTLNDIENQIIRPTFREPLIHFGLVCAAKSCPPLLPKAYTGANVRSLLAQNARNYLASSENEFDAASKTLTLSKIFEWYKEDFGGNDAGLIAFAKKYGPKGMASDLEAAGSVKVAFKEYDWTLNGM